MVDKSNVVSVRLTDDEMEMLEKVKSVLAQRFVEIGLDDIAGEVNNSLALRYILRTFGERL